jgi:hypothetical protein
MTSDAPSRGRLAGLIAAIDAANADDPRRVATASGERPFEVVYAERMSQRLAALYPQAPEELRIAARGQHIRRWDVPRAAYPSGPDGYNAWRRACREHHARLVGELMAVHGYAAEEIARTGGIIRKERLKKDPHSQALENVAALVFLEHYMDDFVAKNADYSEDKLVDILAKTLRKMSPVGHRAALALPLPDAASALLAKALQREAEVLARLAPTAVELT